MEEEAAMWNDEDLVLSKSKSDELRERIDNRSDEAGETVSENDLNQKQPSSS